MSSFIESDINTAIEMIGAVIQIYGHFGTYMIPDKSGYPMNESVILAGGRDRFLNLVYEYYISSERMNRSYFSELKECNATKRFIVSRINDYSYSTGLQWVNEFFSPA